MIIHDFLMNVANPQGKTLQYSENMALSGLWNLEIKVLHGSNIGWQNSQGERNSCVPIPPIVLHPQCHQVCKCYSDMQRHSIQTLTNGKQ